MSSESRHWHSNVFHFGSQNGHTLKRTSQKNMGQETKTVCLREKDRREGVRMSFFFVRTVFTSLRGDFSLVHGF